jgi:hypothetical protein
MQHDNQESRHEFCAQAYPRESAAVLAALWYVFAADADRTTDGWAEALRLKLEGVLGQPVPAELQSSPNASAETVALACKKVCA